MADLKQEANRSAAKFSATRATFERLDTKIGKLAVRVANVEADIVPLRAAVTRRTAAVYRGTRSLDTVAGSSTPNDPIRSARATRFVALANRADHQVIQSLNESVDELRRQQGELETQKILQQQTLNKLQIKQREVEEKLSAMAEAEKQQRARLAQVRQIADRSTATRVNRQVNAAAIDPGPIPVITEFICPIRGPMAFSDSWGDPRSGGRRHKGVDI
ncbi:MAG: hypothetical protein ACREN5_05915, partial [Gemmatimonadales bacterium]